MHGNVRTWSLGILGSVNSQVLRQGKPRCRRCKAIQQLRRRDALEPDPGQRETSVAGACTHVGHSAAVRAGMLAIETTRLKVRTAHVC